ncbi:MAG: peptidylprolyl isomerase [Gammaproteobacteria bacterium]|nr:peptidylprolyl isomerase [Gammaproteobacteria bacterium]
MKKHFKNFLLTLIGCQIFMHQSIASENYPQVEIITTSGSFILELDRNRAPLSVENFLSYVEEGFYSNTVFHRVIQGFVIQAGGYTDEFQTMSTKPEIINESGNGLSNRRMTLGMARSNEPHTANSQFYINLADNSSLDPLPTRWGYAVFGEVINGFEVVDAIAQSATQTFQGLQDVPVAPIIILQANKLAD